MIKYIALYCSLRKKCPHSELFWAAFSRTQSECRKTRTNSEYGQFLRSGSLQLNLFNCARSSSRHWRLFGVFIVSFEHNSHLLGVLGV